MLIEQSQTSDKIKTLLKRMYKKQCREEVCPNEMCHSSHYKKQSHAVPGATSRWARSTKPGGQSFRYMPWDVDNGTELTRKAAGACNNAE